MKKIILSIALIVSTSLSSQVFSDITTSSGISHTYVQSQEMGGGCVWFDYDNDGWEDIYITGGLNKDLLYKNNGDGTFTAVNDIALSITASNYTTAAVSGDVNNDGFRDIFVTTWKGLNNVGAYKRNLLFMNNGDGTFTEKGLDAGIFDAAFSMGAAMIDYNNDGLLDIYVANYIETPNTILDGNGNVIDFQHTCFANYLYKNNGNGTFTEVANSLGVDDTGCSLAVMPTNYDQDGDQDIYVANDFGAWITPNQLFDNNAASFTNASTVSAMNVGIYGMGIAVGDIDKDGDFDYYTCNLGRNVLLLNNGSQVFTDISTSAGVENTYTIDAGNLFTTSWGTAFLDVNNDTWPDLFVANGQVPAADIIATGPNDPNKLYINNGDLTFSDVSIASGINDTNRGRGMAYCDFDKDGDLDVFVVVQDRSVDVNAKSVLYENQLNPAANPGNNWVQFDLKGVSINKDAMGALVKITVNGETLIQEVHGQGSHGSQHSLTLHFGLANATTIDNVEIIWSSSSTQSFQNLAVNQLYSLTEGSSLSVDENHFSKLSIYPNPVTDVLTINNLNDDSTLRIHTIDGKLVKKSILLRSQKTIDVSHLAQGIYLLTINNEKQHFYHTLLKK